jgi:hypothetical protein
MMKTLFVGFVFLGAITVHAQPSALVRVEGPLAKMLGIASARLNTPTATLARNLLNQAKVAGIPTALKMDPVYSFTQGNLDAEGLALLGEEAQVALIQVGKNTTFKSVMGLPESKLALSGVQNLDRLDNVRLSSDGVVKSSVNPESLIEDEVRAVGLSKQVSAELSTELKAIRSEVGISYTNRGMCKGLDDEAAANFTSFLRKARENLRRTRERCPNQLYGSIAESWIQFQKELGREGASLWRAVEKNQACYTSARLRPGVLAAVQRISDKNGGKVPQGEPTGCPL